MFAESIAAPAALEAAVRRRDFGEDGFEPRRRRAHEARLNRSAEYVDPRMRGERRRIRREPFSHRQCVIVREDDVVTACGIDRGVAREVDARTWLGERAQREPGGKLLQNDAGIVAAVVLHDDQLPLAARDLETRERLEGLPEHGCAVAVSYTHLTL